MNDSKLPQGLPSGIAKRIRQVYRPPARQTGWTLEAFLGHDRVRYFSLGRFAFSTALMLAGVTRGDRVLLPEFICRELLGGLHVLGAEPIYYPVGRDLSPAVELSSLGSAEAAMAVTAKP